MKCFFAYEANEKHFSLIHGAKIHIFLQSGYRVCFASFRFCQNSCFCEKVKESRRSFNALTP
jgi:hypothetical protein